jgi:uncharacterized protein (TIGR03083 family)
MDVEQTWTAIEEHRLAIADILGRLTGEQWESPSLCSQWRVRDVVAHLTLVVVPPRTSELLFQALRAGGRFHRLNTQLAISRAARPTSVLVNDLRQHAASRAVPVVSSQANLLLDVLVHGQDIAVPLGLDLPVEVDAAVEAADRIWSMGWPFWARRRLRGLRLVATDARWERGAGPEVRGSLRALLLLLTGRTRAALPSLTGPGVSKLTVSS